MVAAARRPGGGRRSRRGRVDGRQAMEQTSRGRAPGRDQLDLERLSGTSQWIDAPTVDAVLRLHRDYLGLPPPDAILVEEGARQTATPIACPTRYVTTAAAEPMRTCRARRTAGSDRSGGSRRRRRRTANRIDRRSRPEGRAPGRQQVRDDRDDGADAEGDEGPAGCAPRRAQLVDRGPAPRGPACRARAPGRRTSGPRWPPPRPRVVLGPVDLGELGLLLLRHRLELGLFERDLALEELALTASRCTRRPPSRTRRRGVPAMPARSTNEPPPDAPAMPITRARF